MNASAANVAAPALADPPPIPARPHTDALDAVKGVLILFIVLGHDAAAARLFPWLPRLLYGFHVIGFLLLPFLLPSRGGAGRSRPEPRLLADRAVRYLAPYVAFVLVATVLYTLMFAREVPLTLVGWRTFIGLVTGSAEWLKAACGFALFWFLPTLWAQTVLRYGWQVAGEHKTLLLLIIVVHGSVGAWPGLAEVLPLGLGPALFTLPLGLAALHLWPHVQKRPVVTVAVAVVLALGARLADFNTNVAVLKVEDWRHPLRLLLQDAHAVSALLAIAAAGPWLARLPGLVHLGRWSMGVYLGHSFFLQAFLISAQRLGLEPLGGHAKWFALPILVVAIAGGIAVALGLQFEPVRRWIVPRDLRDWPPTRGIR